MWLLLDIELWVLTIAPLLLAVSWYLSIISLTHGVSPVLSESVLVLLAGEGHRLTHPHSACRAQRKLQPPESSTDGRAQRS